MDPLDKIVLHNVSTLVKDVTMLMVYVTGAVIQAGKGTIVEIVIIVIQTNYTSYIFCPKLIIQI